LRGGKVDTFATVPEESLPDLIEQVRSEIDPRRRERARNRLATRILQIARRAAFRQISEADADDIAQSTFPNLESHLLHDEDIEDPEAYIVRAIRNASCRELERQRKQAQPFDQMDTVMPEGEAATGPLPEQTIHSTEEINLLREALQHPRMPERYRVLLSRIQFGGESPEKLVDEAMALPVNHGKSRALVRNSQVDQPFSRAKKRLQGLMKEIAEARLRGKN